MLDLTTLRSAMLVLISVVFVLTLSGIVWTHWSWRRKLQSHFHASTISEMGWSLAPVSMTLALAGVAFKGFWPI